MTADVASPCPPLLFVLLACFLLAEGVCAATTHYIYNGNGDYYSGSFHVSRIESTRTWGSNQLFTDAGNIDSYTYDWSACTSGVQVVFGNGGDEEYASVTMYGSNSLSYSFTNTIYFSSSGPYWLQVRCPTTVAATIQFDDFYTVNNNCGSYAPSVVSSFSTLLAVSVVKGNPANVVTVQGSNINQCGQAFTVTVNGMSASVVSASLTTLVFNAPPVSAAGSYPVIVAFTALWPGSTTLGNLTYGALAVTNTLQGRYFSWNTFDYTSGGTLSIFGSNFGPTCASTGLFLQPTTTGVLPASIPCASVSTGTAGQSVVTFTIPPSPSGTIGYLDTYRLRFGTNGNAIVYSTIPIVYGFGYSDHYEQVDFNMTWTGSWTGTVTSPIRLTRQGGTVTLVTSAYPFNGGAYAGTPVTQISGTSAMPARFRPDMTKKRCMTHLGQGSTAGYDVHMDVGGNGLLVYYQDASGDSFAFTPDIYPETCVWDVPFGAY